MVFGEDKEMPAFIYTCAHSRDLDSIKAMAAALSNNDRKNLKNPDFYDKEGWETLKESID